MSVVTNVMLAVGILDDAGTEAIEDWDQGGQRFRRLDEAESGWGGYKAPEVTLFAAAFNCIHHSEFFSSLAALPWAFPEEVQLFVQGQDDDKWSVYEFENGAWVRLVREQRA